MNTTPPTQPKHALGQYAGFISRLFAFIVDMVILTILLIASSWFLQVIKTFNSQNALINIKPYFPIITNIWAFMFNPITLSVAAALLILGYFVIFFFLAGQTPGKALMGVKVVSLRGGKMKLWQALIRYIGYYISFLVFGLGFIWIILDTRRMGWHDKMARTCVVYSWDARPDENFLLGSLEELQARREAVGAFVSQRRLGKQKIDMSNVVIPETTGDQPVGDQDSNPQ